MWGHYVIGFIFSLINIVIVVGAPALLIVGFALRKSKKQTSKKLLIAGGICLALFIAYSLLSSITYLIANG